LRSTFLEKENVVQFEARHEQNGVPAVTIRDLLKEMLRRRPDRLSWAKFAAAEPSISCSFSTPGAA
jgi:Flp pilus assembly CpaF family ATPase